MQLIPDDLRAQLLANGARRAAGEDIGPYPVIKLFTPDAGATWLLTELDPEDPDIAFGLCDLGLGCPELGMVSLAEIASVRGCRGLAVERDHFFTADRPLSRYVREAAGGAGLGGLLGIDFYKALRFTLTFTFITLPFVILIGVGLALALNATLRSIRGPIIFVSLLPSSSRR